MKLIITYSKVYGDKKVLQDESFSALDKNTWAKVLARLNHLARTIPDYSLKDVISNWFSQGNSEYAIQLYSKIKEAYSKLGKDVSELSTINIWSNLKLLDYVLKFKQDGGEQLDELTSERQLFDIYLITNEIFGEKSDQIYDTVSKDEFSDGVDHFARVTLTLLAPYHDLNHFKALELLIVNFIKSYYCFQFLESDHSELLNLFLKPYGSENWNQYLTSILPIAQHALSLGNDSGLNYLTLDNSPDKEKARVYLNHLSLINGKNYPLKTDFLNARAQPLFKVEDDRYLILDSVLAVNRIYNSTFFELLRLAEKNTNLNDRYGDFFQLYTYDFIEKYLGYSLLERIFRKSQYYKISGADIKEKYGVDTEPDYYVRNGNKVFLFEIKGSVVTGDAKQSFSYSTLEKELKTKYLYNDEKSENKAVIQLVERIRILFNGDADYDEHYKENSVRVYPILIVSELALTTPGINYVLNQWFWEIVEKDEMLVKNKNRIQNLVILDFDTLILYSSYFEKHSGSLESLLIEYFSTIDRRKIKPKKGEQPTITYMHSLMMKSFQPFGKFLRDKLRGQTPDLFLEFGNGLVNGATSA